MTVVGLDRECSPDSALKTGRISAASIGCSRLGVAKAIPEEVNSAALPRHAEHLRDRRLEALVGI